MVGTVGASEVFIIALIVMLVLAAVAFVASRSASAGPSVPVPRPELDAATIRSVSDLVDRGRRIEAIKVLRDATGLGLKESKDWVDGWDPARAANLSHSASTPEPDAAVLEQLAIGARAVRASSGDIHAIKFVREETGWGLADAKAYVDRLGG